MLTYGSPVPGTWAGILTHGGCTWLCILVDDGTCEFYMRTPTTGGVCQDIDPARPASGSCTPIQLNYGNTSILLVNPVAGCHDTRCCDEKENCGNVTIVIYE
jgi:hypothetical protein